MEILQIGIYILKTGAMWRLDCSFALLFLWLFLACTVVSSAASHQEGHSNMGIHLSPDGVNSESFWVKLSIIWQFLKDSFTSFIFKLQHCSQITWPQPVSSHAWLSGKERERKIALVRWHFSADVSVNHVDPPEKLQHTCPTCPLLLPVESHQAVNTARITLASYRRQFVRGAELGVRTITRASAQVWLRFQEKQTFPELHIFPSVESATFPSCILYIRGRSGEKQFCGVHSPEVSRGTDRKRNLPAADAWFWYWGDKNNQASPLNIKRIN